LKRSHTKIYSATRGAVRDVILWEKTNCIQILAIWSATSGTIGHPSRENRDYSRSRQSNDSNQKSHNSRGKAGTKSGYTATAGWYGGK
jgi:hypothetical protein